MFELTWAQSNQAIQLEHRLLQVINRLCSDQLTAYRKFLEPLSKLGNSRVIIKLHKAHRMAIRGDGGSSKWRPPSKCQMGDGGSSKWRPPSKTPMGDGGSSKWRPPSKRQMAWEDNWIGICLERKSDYVVAITFNSNFSAAEGQPHQSCQLNESDVHFNCKNQDDLPGTNDILLVDGVRTESSQFSHWPTRWLHIFSPSIGSEVAFFSNLVVYPMKINKSAIALEFPLDSEIQQQRLVHIVGDNDSFPRISWSCRILTLCCRKSVPFQILSYAIKMHFLLIWIAQTATSWGSRQSEGFLLITNQMWDDCNKGISKSEHIE